MLVVLQHGADGPLQVAVVLATEGVELFLAAFQAIAGGEQALRGLVAAHHLAGRVEDGGAHQQAVDGGGIEQALGVQLVDGGMQVDRLLQVR
ncbi:hypothetical protein D9M68_443640 [compost metagenome]